MCDVPYVLSNFPDIDMTPLSSQQDRLRVPALERKQILDQKLEEHLVCPACNFFQTQLHLCSLQISSMFIEYISIYSWSLKNDIAID